MCNNHNMCCGCSECVKPKGHPHAELMQQYAQDAMTHEKPWELWETFHTYNKKWVQCSQDIYWSEKVKYRRKPRTICINGYDVPEPVYNPCPNTKYYVANTAYGNAIGNKNAHWHSIDDGVGRAKYSALGLLHTTREAAELHAKALLSFTEKG